MRVCCVGEGVGGSNGRGGGEVVFGEVELGIEEGEVRVRRAEGRRISSMPALMGFFLGS